MQTFQWYEHAAVIAMLTAAAGIVAVYVFIFAALVRRGSKAARLRWMK